jgi:hypothetical protein
MVAKRNTSLDNLKVNDSASFSGKVINDVADPVALTDVVNLQTLNAAAIAGGWDESTFNDATGDLKFLIVSVVDFTVNLDGRYQTAAQVQALIDAAAQASFTITLPSAASVAARVAGVTELPAGWALVADGLNLDIQHDLGRYGMTVTVFATTTDPANQQLFDTAAYSGILNVDTNNIKITSLATILKEIRIFISFAQ